MGIGERWRGVVASQGKFISLSLNINKSPVQAVFAVLFITCCSATGGTVKRMINII